MSTSISVAGACSNLTLNPTLTNNHRDIVEQSCFERKHLSSALLSMSIRMAGACSKLTLNLTLTHYQRDIVEHSCFERKHISSVLLSISIRMAGACSKLTQNLTLKYIINSKATRSKNYTMCLFQMRIIKIASIKHTERSYITRNRSNMESK